MLDYTISTKGLKLSITIHTDKKNSTTVYNFKTKLALFKRVIRFLAREA